LSFTALQPGASIGGLMRQLCDIIERTASVDSTGMGYPGSQTTTSNVPCSLQPMSSANTMQYRAENSDGLYDLYLPTRIEGQSAPLTTSADAVFKVDGLYYRALGGGVRQGLSGVQMVPVTEYDYTEPEA
jgi:hypothetical protein